ncbi:unnamed protein product [Heterobilharzia americana]|nr:unnamed protein product [Heterobilharzia americana]
MKNSFTDFCKQYRNEAKPKWGRFQIGLLIGCFATVAGILAVLSIYEFAGTKPTHTLELPFWKSTVGYWVDVFAFKDSSGDFVGDLNGLASEVDYIKSVIGAGYVILGSITKGFYTNQHNTLGLVDDYEELDESVGTIKDFRLLIKRFHKQDVKIILTFDFNSVSINHKWVVNNTVKLADLPKNVGTNYTRYGKPSNVEITSQNYYSVFGYPSVDLNLTDSHTQKAIIDVIDYWMKEGIDGILLDNCAFLVEDSDTSKRSQAMTMSSWFESYPTHQLYRPGSLQFVQLVRQEINKWIRKTGKEKVYFTLHPVVTNFGEVHVFDISCHLIQSISSLCSLSKILCRLLAVYTGDAGYGLSNESDPMLMFKDMVDVIISREFVTYRGWKIHSNWNNADMRHYAKYSDEEREKLGLCVSTPSDPLSRNLVTLAATFLLPGVPIIYYGTELGVNTFQSNYYPDIFYPKERDYFIGTSPLTHLPMPWNSDGKRFSKAINDSRFVRYLRLYDILDTVEDSLVEGREDTILGLVRSLVTLRENPSLKWGAMEKIRFPTHVRQLVFVFVLVLLIKKRFTLSSIDFDVCNVLIMSNG